MSSQTRRISPNEWESLKDDLWNLSRQKDFTLEKVRGVMKERHEFNASIAQYEAQFRSWGFRKNISRDEWAAVIGIIDKLDSPPKETRVLISGEPVDPSRVQRWRRKFKKERYRNSDRKQQGRSADLKNISIEIRGTDGNWTPSLASSKTVSSVRNEAHRQSSSPNASIIHGPRFGPNNQQESYGQVNQEIDDLDTATELQPDLSHILDPQDFAEWAVEEVPSLVSLDLSQHNTSMVFNQQFPQPELPNLDDWNFMSQSLDPMIWAEFPSPLSSPIPSRRSFNKNLSYILDTLPFKHFMKDLGPLGNITVNRPLSSNANNSSITRSSFKRFLEDVNSCMAEKDRDLSRKSLSDVTNLLSILRSQMPNTDTQGGYNSGHSLMIEDEILQVKLEELLLFSTANGFMGLEGIPIQCVLKYLRRCGKIRLLLKTNHSHVGKSLVENIFRAAIEDQDKDALKYLLAIPSIDVNSMICTIHGQRYTPVERAASLQDLGMVKMLLEAKADVGKTYGSGYLDRGPVDKLLDSIYSGKTTSFTTNITEIAKLLLDHGAKLNFEAVKCAFQLTNSQVLAYCLISRVADADHATYIREGYLSHIAIQLDDRQATQATKNIIMACERSKCQRCKRDYGGKLDWALIQAAKCKRLELVKLLLLYSKTPHRALSAALRADCSNIIEAILTLKPDINAPAHSIDYKEWETRSSDDAASTTSYAEAIEARNEKFILEMERRGALELLNEEGRFEPAITAASKIGDLMLVRKLLDSCPSPEPLHMYPALLCSIEQDDEEIFWTLLAAGADVNGDRSLDQNPLFLAVSRRNPRMVRGILDADLSGISFHMVYKYKGAETSIIEQALQWGDREIIQDLLFASPRVPISGNYQLILDLIDKAQFEFFINCGLFDTYALTGFLEVGLKQGNTELVQQLVDRGADPTDSSVLAMCLGQCPAIIRKCMSFRKGNHVIPGFGSVALMNAIRSGQTGLAAVKLLLETGFVDAAGFPDYPEKTRDYVRTPLGETIEVVRKGHYAGFEMIESLLSYGCDPNSIVHHDTNFQPNIKQTALLEAVQTRSKKLVELLVDKGADVNQEAKIGLKRTPLQKAVEENSLEIVTLLLDRGADPNGKPAQRGGATAFQFAAIRGNCVIAAKLLEHEADPQAPPAAINGRRPLEGAAENGRMEMIYFLWHLDCGCFDVERCQRALKLAEENGHMACKVAIEELSQQIVPPLLTEQY